MTILTCDYNGHKEIYTADGKEVDYSTFCDLRAKKTPSKPIKQPLNLS
ncbi:hypothetical protein LA342_08590 [Campylobacter upsaliensis]|nr:hypothetical protein [Campylobacter upsaliensis]MCA5589824.1 hypothetical protein [Campylobacter upsaliensis]